MTGTKDGSDARRWWTAPAAVAGIAAAAVSIMLARPSSFLAPRLPGTLDLGTGKFPARSPAPAPRVAHPATQSAPGRATGRSVTAILVTRPVVQEPAASTLLAGTTPAAADTSATSAAAPAPPSVDPPAPAPETAASDNPNPVATSRPEAPGGWTGPSSDQSEIGDGAGQATAGQSSAGGDG